MFSFHKAQLLSLRVEAYKVDNVHISKQYLPMTWLLCLNLNSQQYTYGTGYLVFVCIALNKFFIVIKNYSLITDFFTEP